MEQNEVKFKLITVVAAVIVFSSVYMLWSDDKKQRSLLTNEEGVNTVTMMNDNPEQPLQPNQPSQRIASITPSPLLDSSTELLPVPAPVDDSRQDWPDTVRLWSEAKNAPSTTIDGMPATRLQVDPERLRQLHVGQTLTLDIPHAATALEAKITSTHNNSAGVKVWRADIADAAEEAGVIISQGKVQTHLIIASEQGNYSVVIDNKTGESTLIDEGEINARQAPIDDGIAVGPPDDSTLPSLN